MKKIAIGFAILGTAICAFVAWRELASPTPRYVELGNILVLTLTLIVLVWYAYDTNAIARITRERWEREGVLATTYSIAMPGTSVGDNGHTVFQLKNGSPLVVRALVNFNFKVYGHPVAAGPFCMTERRSGSSIPIRCPKGGLKWRLSCSSKERTLQQFALRPPMQTARRSFPWFSR